MKHTFHEVTQYDGELGWDATNRKWCTYEECKGSCWSSHARFKTRKRAEKNALGLHYRGVESVVMCRWVKKNGRRLMDEWWIGGKK